jgi:hypothetical protein
VKKKKFHQSKGLSEEKRMVRYFCKETINTIASADDRRRAVMARPSLGEMTYGDAMQAYELTGKGWF